MKRSLCHVFSLHFLRNAASRDWSNGKNNSFIAWLTRKPRLHRGDNPKQARLKAACTRMYWNYRVAGIRIGEFVNSTSLLMLQYLTSKVIDIIANSECMPWF
ncbi:hypothetical protein AVEN_172836-1 [Araneus ventricosus]|uniref:Uncharacterized protein n=1 Tax=Araneus ventricosus TaxID=182803 RepID=A0A4Y2BI57_ARAVE|nr:hypothetical protein AVEN_172836-1 [Araneus ventricosus]